MKTEIKVGSKVRVKTGIKFKTPKLGIVVSFLGNNVAEIKHKDGHTGYWSLEYLELSS